MGTTSINHDIKSSSLINTQIIAVTEGKERLRGTFLMRRDPNVPCGAYSH